MRWVAIILAVIFCAGGCASKPTKPAVESLRGSDFEVLEAVESEEPLRAEDFKLMWLGTRRFGVIDEGGGISEYINVRLEPTRLYRAAVEMNEGDTRTSYLSDDDDGNILLHAVVEHGDNAISLFDPPHVLALHEMNAGASRETESAMRVLDQKNPRKQRERGTSKRTITYAGEQRIRTPLGEMVAKRVEVEFNADLRMAAATEMTTLFIVPRRGIVAELSTENVKILGAFGRKSRRTLVLVE